MFARVGAWKGSPEEMERWITGATERVKPNVQQQSGIKAAYWFADRSAGKGLTITIWESEEAMQASEQFRAKSQSTTSALTGASVTTERYEVVDYL